MAGDQTTIYTEGVCADGAAILRDGVPVPISEVLAELNAAATMEQMQHTIDDLHQALWAVLWMNGGEVVISPCDIIAMPRSGVIEWLSCHEKMSKIIRIQDEKIRERAP